MRTLLVIGIGAGNPEHMTVQAINGLNRADVLFIPTKGEQKTELADVRRDIIGRYVTNPGARMVEYAVPVRKTADRTYGQSVDAWHASKALGTCRTGSCGAGRDLGRDARDLCGIMSPA